MNSDEEINSLLFGTSKFACNGSTINQGSIIETGSVNPSGDELQTSDNNHEFLKEFYLLKDHHSPD